MRIGKILWIVLIIVVVFLICFYFIRRNDLFGWDTREFQTDKKAEESISESKVVEEERESKMEIESETKSEIKPEIESETESEIKPETESEIEPKVESEIKTETEIEKKREIIEEKNDVETISGQIEDECYNIMGAITSGKFNTLETEDGITAAENNNSLVYIYIERGYWNQDYEQTYYFDGDKLIYAEYLGEDLNIFYFENNKLIRWRCYPNSSDINNFVDHDKENTFLYCQWEERTLDDSKEISIQLKNEQQTAQNHASLDHEPFYGVWCMASQDQENANENAEEIQRWGYDAKVFYTTDWSNLNDGWFAVSAGTYYDEESAQSILNEIKKYYPDAYVKYSGEWTGE